jgi:hypothetical protein
MPLSDHLSLFDTSLRWYHYGKTENCITIRYNNLCRFSSMGYISAHRDGQKKNKCLLLQNMMLLPMFFSNGGLESSVPRMLPSWWGVTSSDVLLDEWSPGSFLTPDSIIISHRIRRKKVPPLFLQLLQAAEFIPSTNTNSSDQQYHSFLFATTSAYTLFSTSAKCLSRG